MSISIPDLNSASTVDSDDVIWSVVDGGDRQVAFSVLADFIRSQFGSLSEPAAPPNNDLNDADETFALYRTDSGTANSPGSNRMVLHIALEDGSRAVQIAISAAATELLDVQFRELSGDGWSAWQEVYHQASILGTVSQSGGTPTGAVIERGSNSNGEYVRFADGTQICTSNLEVDVASSTGQTFSFPASFEGDRSEVTTSFSHKSGSPSQGLRFENIRALGHTTDKWVILLNGSGTSTDPSSDSESMTAMAIGRWF